MHTKKYYFAALSAFIIWGFFSLALKPLQSYPSLDILFYRIFYATTLLLIINCIFRRKAIANDVSIFRTLPNKERTKVLFLTVIGGFLLIMNWFLFIFAVNHVSLKSASFAYLLCPILTTILAFFILKEKLSNWQWLAVALSLVSCALLSLGSTRDLMYSFVIALTFALYLISQRKNNQFDRFLVLTFQMIVATAVTLPFFPKYAGVVPQEAKFYIFLTLIVVVFTIVPMFLNLYALKGITSSTVGILMYTNPLINFMLAVFYFKEAVDGLQLASYVLILISVIIFNEKFLFRRKSKTLAEIHEKAH